MRLIDGDALKVEQIYALVNDKSIENGISFAPITCVLKEEIDNAPTLERPQGEWKVDGYLIACNKCGRILLKASKLYNFCPNCGADMRKGGAE